MLTLIRLLRLIRTRTSGTWSPLAFVWSLNGVRRHLSTSQLAAIAVNMLPALAEEAKKRQQLHAGTAPGKPKETLPPGLEEVNESGETADRAAAITGVSKSYVQYANRVKKTDPELFARIISSISFIS